MTALRVTTVKAFDCRCERCGHEWRALKLPKACARCKQIGWQTEPGLTGLGRPPLKRGRPPLDAELGRKGGKGRRKARRK